MSQLLQLAKQGDANAIAVLINKSLNLERITAKVRRRDNLLQIVLESSEVPDQNRLVEIIQSGIVKLEVSGINTLEIFGRKTGEKGPAWGRKVSLTTQKISATSNPQPQKQDTVSPKLTEGTGLKQQVPTWIVITLGSVFSLGFLGFAYSQINPSDQSSLVVSDSSPSPITKSSPLPSVALMRISDIAGKTPEQVSTVLGLPTKTEMVKPSRTPCPCTLHYYKGEIVEIVFMNGKADWISVNLPASQVDTSGSYLSVQQFENPTYTYVKVRTD
jgi:hypothetical protein